jgi:SAM-dependent methyltransferase
MSAAQTEGEQGGSGTSQFDFDAVFRADDYLYFYGDSLKDEYSEQEVGFLVRELSLQKRMSILDLACGHGRHANRLAAQGFAVTGVDRSQEFLAIAGDDAKQRRVSVRYICADVRKYMVVKEYDRVIHLFSSFGYFTDPENDQVIRNIAASLKTGGMLCLDILNRDAALKYLPASAVREKDGGLLIDRNRFDPLTGRLYNDRIVIRDGQRRDTPFFLRLYSATEITALLEQRGLVVKKIFGDWDGKPFGGESRRMIVIAEKE